VAAENIIVIQKNYLNLNHFQLSSDYLGYLSKKVCYAWNTADRVLQLSRSDQQIVLYSM
jgi:hypothetical protein